MAVDKLYEGATTLQDMLDTAHKHPTLLIEVLENAVQDHPFFLYADRISSFETPHAFYHSCLEAINKAQIHIAKLRTSPKGGTLFLTEP